MEKKYTKKQIEMALEKASTKAVKKDIEDLEKMTKEQGGKVDVTFVTVQSMKNVVFLSELKKFFWEVL